MSTAFEILSNIPDQLLDAQVSDLHIGLIAKDMKKWEILMPFLGITEAEKEEISADNCGSYLQQKQSFLFRWKEKYANEASYRRLIVAVCALDVNALAMRIKRLILHIPDQISIGTSIIDKYRSFLQDCYREAKHPSNTQWPFSAFQSYIDLSLQDIPLSDLIPNDKEQVSRKTVDLRTIFTAGNNKDRRKIILIEGNAGSGKTTLSWHACQQWAEGKLFGEYRLLIHVSLNDPAIRSASTLADIIPHPSEEMRENIAKAIAAEQQGKGVCFLFDACDEAPPSVWQGFLRPFLQGTSSRSMLPQCTILMTARPEIVLQCPSIPLLITRKLKLCGFEGEMLEKFVKNSLPNEKESIVQILEHFKLNPVIATLCSTPINAVIMIHLFRGKSLQEDFPSTSTGLFKAFVCNLLIRNTHKKEDKLIFVENFTDLPSDVSIKFRALCSLAFTSLMKIERVINQSTLVQLGIKTDFEDSFGFLQVYQHLTSYGPKRQYTFLHLAFQEFLAAIHLSQMGDDKQAEVIQQLLNDSPLNPVLPFYAGLTRLACDKACKILLRVAKQPLNSKSIFKDLRSNPCRGNDRRRLFVALLNCLYESQQSSIIKSINPPCHGHTVFDPIDPTRHISESDNDETRGLHIILYSCDVCLSFLELNPIDCLSLGHFLRRKKMHVYWKFDMTHCSITDTGFEALLQQVKLGTDTVPSIDLGFLGNNFSLIKPILLKEVLSGNSKLRSLTIDQCSTESLRYLTEGLYQNTVFNGVHPYLGFQLVLYNCLQPFHVHHLLLLLYTHKNVQVLNLSKSNFEGMFHLLAAALKSTSITLLKLEECGIGDLELHILEKAICEMKALHELYIAFNNFSSHALTNFLKHLLDNDKHTLTYIWPDEFCGQLNEKQEKILKSINEGRSRANTCRLTVQSQNTYTPKLDFRYRMQQWTEQPHDDSDLLPREILNRTQR